MLLLVLLLLALGRPMVPMSLPLPRPQIGRVPAVGPLVVCMVLRAHCGVPLRLLLVVWALGGPPAPIAL